MKASAPTVSVIMAMHNDARFVGQAIEGVLMQTFTEFELVIVDDASTDDSGAIVAQYKDPRIRLLVNEENVGQAAARNVAISHACGKYIAVHDADDVSAPHRLQAQIAYLDAHPEVVMVGSSAFVIDESGARKATWTVPSDDLEIKWSMLFANPFVHSSVMMRSSILATTGGYSEEAQWDYVEDYELATRLAERGQVANLPGCLVSWREKPGSVSSRNRARLLQQLERVSQRCLESLVPQSRLAQDFQALRTLLLSGAGQRSDLTRSEVVHGLGLVESLQRAFYGANASDLNAIRAHSRHCAWHWGKHLLALACGNNGSRDLRCRLTLATAAMRMLGQVGGRHSA